MQGGLEVDGAQRRGGAERVGGHAVLVHRQRDEGDAEAGRDALDDGEGERFDAEAATGRHQRGDGGGDGLPAVAREEQPPRVGRPVAAGEMPGGGLPRGSRTGRAGRPQRLGQRVAPVHQMRQALREQRGLVGQQREVQLQVDPVTAGLGQRGLGRRRGRTHEGAAADLAHGQSAPPQLPVDPRRRRRGDPPVAGEPPQRRRQPLARPEAAGGDVRRQTVGDRAKVLHRHALPPYCTEHIDNIVPRDCPL